MFNFIHYILILIFINYSYATHLDEFILRNNAPTEQKVVLRFQSRLLLKSNDEIVAPFSLVFLNEKGEKVSSITPYLDEFIEFQRKNFDVETEQEITLPAGAEQTITSPYFLTRNVSILSSDNWGFFDLDNLFYTGSLAFPKSCLEIIQPNNLKKIEKYIRDSFSFSRRNNTPDPEHEIKKPSNLRCPAPLIRKSYGKTNEEALLGIDYLEAQSLDILHSASTAIIYSEPETPIAPPSSPVEEEELFEEEQLGYDYCDTPLIRKNYRKINSKEEELFAETNLEYYYCNNTLIRRNYRKTNEKALRGIDYLEAQSLDILHSASITISTTPSELVTFKKTHRMWITSSDSPVEPPEEQLEHYINSVARLNLGDGWTHKFWCWDKLSLPRTCKILEGSGQNIEIVEFRHPNILEKIIAKHFVFAAIDHGLFTVAGNILRNNVILDEGGFYSDIGAQIKRDPSPLLKNSDIIAHHRIGRVDRRAWWIDHDFMAAKAGNPIIKEFLNRVNTLHELASNPEIVEFFRDPKLAHSWTNARLLTEVFTFFSEPNAIKTLILPNDESIIAAHHQTSWYGGDGKSCKDIDKTTMSWFKVTPNYQSVRDSLIEDGFDLARYREHFAPTLSNPGELTHHFLTQQKLGIIPFIASEERPLPLTVTLTSWQGKIREAHIAILSLFSQTLKPNKIVLWLADEEFSDRKVPSTISHLLPRGLEIKWCENIRSAKKLIPSLRDSELNQTILVTADDDVKYQPNWLEDLYLEHCKHPTAIIAHRARAMKFNEDSMPTNYNSWRLQIDPSTAESKILFPTGSGGILFPPGSLHSEASNAAQFMKLCQTGDDIFWFAMAVLQGTKIRIPPSPQTTLCDLNDTKAEELSLWTTNKTGKNDEMIKSVFTEYGIYDLLKRNLGRC